MQSKIIPFIIPNHILYSFLSECPSVVQPYLVLSNRIWCSPRLIYKFESLLSSIMADIIHVILLLCIMMKGN